MSIKEMAKTFAIEAHRGQVRKSEPEKPMIMHPISVGIILKEYGYDDNVVAAGYLHDVVEDTEYTLDDIKERFGDDVADLVCGASEPDKSLSWEERKQHTIDSLKDLPLRNKLVVCADKISNLTDLNIIFKRNGTRDFSAFKRGEKDQAWYYTNVYKSLVHNEDENLPIFKALKAVLEEVFNPVESDKPSNAIKLEAKMDEIKQLKKLIFQENWVAVGNVTCAYGKSLHEDEFQKTISKLDELRNEYIETFKKQYDL
ncbi:MAG: bifunctional (p)ppGpp synthetase/guanosine-3',5'-bis(diphosphate) 3'-pyrophosphohydrolase [Clostridia bacterium]|nr:bifunctional (p)ppGpp synthetase/guanosine-3',5'-bis(diphosphate) 3'-pyrophosphohydrolase [Clostridia bacterium]